MVDPKSNISALHVVGVIFAVSYPDGNPRNADYDMQTVTIPPGGSYTVEFTAPEPGYYTIVSHALADASRGAVAMLHVSEEAPVETELMPDVGEKVRGASGGH